MTALLVYCSTCACRTVLVSHLLAALRNDLMKHARRCKSVLNETNADRTASAARSPTVTPYSPWFPFLIMNTSVIVTVKFKQLCSWFLSKVCTKELTEADFTAKKKKGQWLVLYLAVNYVVLDTWQLNTHNMKMKENHFKIERKIWFI